MKAASKKPLTKHRYASVHLAVSTDGSALAAPDLRPCRPRRGQSRLWARDIPGLNQRFPKAVMDIFLFGMILLSLFSVVHAQDLSDWTLDLNFDDGVPGEQVSEFTDASGLTTYNNNIIYNGQNSAQLSIHQGSDGWGSWGGRKELPELLGEGDELWVRVRTFMPEDFDYSTNFALKFLRFRVSSGDGDHIGYVDIYIRNDGTYKYQNEQYTTTRFIFSSLQGEYQVGETVLGSNSGASATITAIKPATADNAIHIVFSYSDDSEPFQRWENITGLSSGATGVLDRVDTNSVTNFGSEYPVRKSVWETYVYRVRFSTTNPLIQFYKHIGESGFTNDGKPIGGNLQLLFEDTSDQTLGSPSSLITHFLLFTYWNGNAPRSQSMYIDDLLISTSAPPELSETTQNPGEFSFNPSVYTVVEGADPSSVTLTINRSNGSTGIASIDLVTGSASDSAVPPGDYLPISQTLTFADSETYKNVTINIIDDDTAGEGDEYFSATLSNPSGGATLSPIATAIVTIQDNDTVNSGNTPPVLERLSDITVIAGETITLAPSATDADNDSLSFSYSGFMTSNSKVTTTNDVGTHSVTVTVSDGELSDSQTISITVLASRIVESRGGGGVFGLWLLFLLVLVRLGNK